jgi:hypothetical protein
MASFNIYDRKILKNSFLPLFDQYPLLTSRYFDYLKFKKALNILENSNLTQNKKNQQIEVLINEKLPENYKSPALKNLHEESDYHLIQNTISIY